MGSVYLSCSARLFRLDISERTQLSRPSHLEMYIDGSRSTLVKLVPRVQVPTKLT